MACLIGNITSLRKNQFNAISSSAFFFCLPSGRFNRYTPTDISCVVHPVLRSTNNGSIVQSGTAVLFTNTIDKATHFY